MWWGIAIHRYLEYCYTKGRPEALRYIRTKFSRMYNTCRRIPVHLLAKDAEVEIAWAYNSATQEVRRVKYPTRPNTHEWYARVDWLGEKGGLPHVVDWKTGMAEGVTPVGHAQLMSIACAARAEAGTREAYASIVAIPSSGHLLWRTVRYSGALLDEFDARCTKLQADVTEDRRRLRVYDTVPPFLRGATCEWCAIKPVCPAWNK